MVCPLPDHFDYSFVYTTDNDTASSDRRSVSDDEPTDANKQARRSESAATFLDECERARDSLSAFRGSRLSRLVLAEELDDALARDTGASSVTPASVVAAAPATPRTSRADKWVPVATVAIKRSGGGARQRAAPAHAASENEQLQHPPEEARPEAAEQPSLWERCVSVTPSRRQLGRGAPMKRSAATGAAARRRRSASYAAPHSSVIVGGGFGYFVPIE